MSEHDIIETARELSRGKAIKVIASSEVEVDNLRNRILDEVYHFKGSTDDVRLTINVKETT